MTTNRSKRQLDAKQGVSFGILGQINSPSRCRIMCNQFIGAEYTRSSNPHQLNWSSFQAKNQSEQQEPFLDTLIGGLALVGLFVGLAFI